MDQVPARLTGMHLGHGLRLARLPTAARHLHAQRPGPVPVVALTFLSRVHAPQQSRRQDAQSHAHHLHRHAPLQVELQQQRSSTFLDISRRFFWFQNFKNFKVDSSRNSRRFFKSSRLKGMAPQFPPFFQISRPTNGANFQIFKFRAKIQIFKFRAWQMAPIFKFRAEIHF